MKLGRTFITRESEQKARELITSHLEQAGYKLSSSGPFLIYERGSHYGSLFSSSPKRWKVKVTIQVKPGSNEVTDVEASFDIDTRGQIVTKKERGFWESEMDRLIAAVNGFNAEVTTAAKVEERLRLERQFKEGTSWFFWIAGLSLVNSVILTIGGGWNFLIGLGITQLVDGFASAVATYFRPEVSTTIQVLALIIDVGVAGVFALLGFFAKKGHRWGFTVGMTLYALDGLIFLIVPDFVSIGFHIFALFWMFAGLRANRRLSELEEQNQGLAG